MLVEKFNQDCKVGQVLEVDVRGPHMGEVAQHVLRDFTFDAKFNHFIRERGGYQQQLRLG